MWFVSQYDPSATSGLSFFFFFQAEDGIRDVAVTGVQTCALPISAPEGRAPPPPVRASRAGWCGAVLTGGCTNLHGMPELAEEVLGLPVRRGLPRGIGGLTDVVKSPQHATAVDRKSVV